MPSARGDRFRPGPVTLTHSNVILSPLSPAHREGLSRAAADPRIFRYLGADLRSDNVLDRWIETALAEQEVGHSVPFTIIDPMDDAVVGSTRYLNIAAEHCRLEIGWTWLAPAAWGGAVNPAAKLLLLSHAFDTLGAVRVELRTDARNARSRVAIRKIGAREEGILRRHMLMPNDYVRDTVQFAIVDQDWPDARRTIEGMIAERRPKNAR